MASWSEVESEAPEFAARVGEIFDAHTHKTIATLRADGSPRISGIEASFEEGELGFGSMAGARKAADLRRDPRFALHSGTGDADPWQGDAKVSGRAVELTDSASGDAHMFRADIEIVSIVGLNEARNRLVIEVWRPGEGVRRVERE